MTELDPADDLLRFIDASRTPYHAVAESVRRLTSAGYRALDEGEPWKLSPGDKLFVVRGDSTIAAFELGSEPPSRAGFLLTGAHTDSPNLRVKPNPDATRHGCHQLGVDVYGGVLLYTWLDRDLSLAGRVTVRRGMAVDSLLIDLERPVLRLPSLAIHLDRMVNKDGLVVNPQKHLPPLSGLEAGGPLRLATMLVAELEKRGVKVAEEDILSFDLCCYDAAPSTRSGFRGDLLSAPRLDNLGSCHAALTSLLAAAGERKATRGIVLYDHEECGSRSAKGAASPFLRSMLERIARAVPEAGPDAFDRAMARSFLISADMAHAVHPNHGDKHDPEHAPRLGGGPVVKINVNQSYATDGESWARFERVCREAEVPTQRFVTRSDLVCGSTIGPITAAELGIRTVDVGNPMLAMHSCREMAAAADVPFMIAALTRFFSS